MNTMNVTMTFNQFVVVAEKDASLFFLQAAKNLAIWWLRIILMVFLFMPVLIVAQIVPFIFGNHLAKIFRVLPYIKEQKHLYWLRDAFQLYYFALKAYKPFCLFRKRINALMEEIDEHIDSLTYVLENQPFLQRTIEGIEHYSETLSG